MKRCVKIIISITFYSKKVSELSVLVGTNNLVDKKAYIIKVDYFKYHEEFQRKGQKEIDKGYNDIGLVHLFTPLPFNARISRIKLQNTPLKRENLTAVFTGWGITEVHFHNFCCKLIKKYLEKNIAY